MSKPSGNRQAGYFVSVIHIIIGMPPHIIIIGMPMVIMAIIRSQHIFIMSMVMPPSMGVIVQVIPVGVIWAVILHIGIIIGMPMPPAIMGIPPIMFIGICIIIGIMPIGMGMAFIGICIAGIMVKHLATKDCTHLLPTQI